MNKVRYYYTLETLLNGASITTFNTFKSFVVGTAEFNTVAIDAAFEPVFNILANRHLKDYILYKDFYGAEVNDPSFDPTVDTTEYAGFARQFYQIYLSTYERYLLILGLYTAQKSNLLNKIQNNTKTTFNDTPQNGGNWDNDAHLSTITTTTNETDVVPLINRLNDIEKLYSDVISDWADEFKLIFIQASSLDYDAPENEHE